MSEWTMFSEPSSHSTVNLVGMYCGERERERDEDDDDDGTMKK